MKRRLRDLDEKQKDIYIIEFVVILLALAAQFWLLISGRLDALSGTSLFDVTAHFICTLLALILLVGCVLLNNSGKLIENPFFTMMLAGNTLGMFMSSVALFTEGIPGIRSFRILIFTIIFLISPMMVFLYWNYYLREKKPKSSYTVAVSYVIDFLLALIVILIGLNIIGGFFFTIDENGMYHREALYFVCVVILGVLCFLMVMHICMEETESLKDKVIFSIYPLAPLAAGIIQSLVDGITVTNISEFFVLQLLYSQIYVQQSRRMAEQDARLARQKMDIMVSQMQPHFVFNALNTICYLCRINPKQAETTTASFAEYLRANLNELGKENVIPFEKEKRHAEIYLEIEKLRFGDAFDVVWDLEISDFELPALTIQPLVENAVKYGMAGRKSGGIIEVSTRRGVGSVLVQIKDNGNGFDPSKPFGTERSHIGMENVRSRLEALSNGKMIVDSAIGEGTSILLRIPWEV